MDDQIHFQWKTDNADCGFPYFSGTTNGGNVKGTELSESYAGTGKFYTVCDISNGFIEMANGCQLAKAWLWSFCKQLKVDSSK